MDRVKRDDCGVLHHKDVKERGGKNTTKLGARESDERKSDKGQMKSRRDGAIGWRETVKIGYIQERRGVYLSKKENE